jgi:hypothetical protein
MWAPTITPQLVSYNTGRWDSHNPNRLRVSNNSIHFILRMFNMDNIACCTSGVKPQKTNIQPFQGSRINQGSKYDWSRLGQSRSVYTSFRSHNKVTLFEDRQSSMRDFNHESIVQWEAFKRGWGDQECFWRDTRFKCLRKPMKRPTEQIKQAQPTRDTDIKIPAKRSREKQVLEFNGVKYTVIKLPRYKV